VRPSTRLGIALDGGQRRRLGARVGVSRRQQAHHRHQVVAVGEAGAGCGGGRVQIGGGAELRGRLGEGRRRGGPAQQIAPAQLEVVGNRVGHGGRGDRRHDRRPRCRRVRRQQLDRQLTRHPLGDGAFDLQGLAQLDVLALAPDGGAVGGPHQPHGDASTLAIAPHAAFEKIGGAQLAADLGGVTAAPFERHDRSPSDDGEPSGPQAAQARDELLGETVGEKVLARIAAQVGERQHGDSHRRHAGRPSRAEPPGSRERQRREHPQRCQRRAGGSSRQGTRRKERPDCGRNGRTARTVVRRRRPGDHGDWRQQAIAALGNGFDEAGGARLVAQRPPQLADAAPDHVVADEPAFPDLAHQLVLGDHAAGAARQADQDLHHLRLDLDGHGRGGHRGAGGGIDAVGSHVPRGRGAFRQLEQVARRPDPPVGEHEVVAHRRPLRFGAHWQILPPLLAGSSRAGYQDRPFKPCGADCHSAPTTVRVYSNLS
jgi:hypothetical protein